MAFDEAGPSSLLSSRRPADRPELEGIMKVALRVFCRPCLDWTERRRHIGAALAQRCFDLKWVERSRDSRALRITPTGRRGLMEHFALSV
jgi:hypothetical protein